jgi:hypothetical protein
LNKGKHNQPGVPVNVPRQGAGQNAHITEGMPDGNTAHEGAHRQTEANTSPDPANEVQDPHPSDEEHPYDAAAPGCDTMPPSDTTVGRQNLGPNPAIHKGKAPPRPHNAGSGPE